MPEVDFSRVTAASSDLLWTEVLASAFEGQPYLVHGRGHNPHPWPVTARAAQSDTPDEALLADGNFSIDGDPVALLRRCAALLAPGGRVVGDLSPPGEGMNSRTVHLESSGMQSGSFRWSLVDPDAAVPVPATVAVCALGVGVFRVPLRAPAAAGPVIVGTVTVTAVLVLGRFGVRADNVTPLDANSTLGWLVVLALTLVAVAIMGVAQRRRPGPHPTSRP